VEQESTGIAGGGGGIALLDWDDDASEQEALIPVGIQ
jgi:hypothetical protein